MSKKGNKNGKHNEIIILATTITNLLIALIHLIRELIN